MTREKEETVCSLMKLSRSNNGKPRRNIDVDSPLLALLSCLRCCSSAFPRETLSSSISSHSFFDVSVLPLARLPLWFFLSLHLLFSFLCLLSHFVPQIFALPSLFGFYPCPLTASLFFICSDCLWLSALSWRQREELEEEEKSAGEKEGRI